MKSYSAKLIGTITLTVLCGVSASAEEFCVTSVGNDYPAKLDRESDVDLRPTTLVTPNNGGAPIFYNKSTQQDGYGYRTETKDYGPRSVQRYLFWSLNEKGNFFGPFNLKQDYYRGIQQSRGRTKVIYDPISGSNYFEASIRDEDARTTGSGRSYGHLVEIPRDSPPKVWSAENFFPGENSIGALRWEADFQTPVISVGRNKVMIRTGVTELIPTDETRDSENFYETLAIEIDGEYFAMRSNRVNSVIPKKGDYLPPVAKGTIVKTLRATADEGWFVGNVGRVYHDGLGGGYFTYTTAFRAKKQSSGAKMIAKKKFRPRTIFPFRSTGKCQVFSPVLKRVIFCSRGKYLKKGKIVKMKGAVIPKDMKYLGDDTESQTALFESLGRIFQFDGKHLTRLASPHFRGGNNRVFRVSGRQFIFLAGQLFELSNNSLKKVTDYPSGHYGAPSQLVSTGQDVILVVPTGIYKITDDNRAVNIWEPPTGDYISHNSHQFLPANIPYLDSVLFGTFTKPISKKTDRFDEIQKFHLIGPCEKI